MYIIYYFLTKYSRERERVYKIQHWTYSTTFFSGQTRAAWRSSLSTPLIHSLSELTYLTYLLTHHSPLTTYSLSHSLPWYVVPIYSLPYRLNILLPLFGIIDTSKEELSAFNLPGNLHVQHADRLPEYAQRSDPQPSPWLMPITPLRLVLATVITKIMLPHVTNQAPSSVVVVLWSVSFWDITALCLLALRRMSTLLHEWARYVFLAALRLLSRRVMSIRSSLSSPCSPSSPSSLIIFMMCYIPA